MHKKILALTMLTGISGLVFQVAWQKYFAILLGGEALSSALVVSSFLGGLALGYALFGAWASGRSRSDLLRMAGYAEIGIGLWALLFPLLFAGIWSKLEYLPASGPAQIAVDLLLALSLLLPSTILMGSTLPLLTRGLADADDELAGVHSRLYGINTLGAFIGSLCAGFFLIEFLGLPYTLVALSALNFLAGFAFIRFAGSLNGTVASKSETEPVAKARLPWPATVFAFVSGFLSIGVEILLIRSTSLALGTSEYSYSLVVGVFVLMIALGTLSLNWVRPRTRHHLFTNQICVMIGLILVYLTVPYWGFAAMQMRQEIPASLALYSATVFSMLLALIAVPAFFMGRTMPLLFSHLKSRMPEAASTVGRLYAANTLGCCLGGMVLGYFFLLFFNADEIFRFAILIAALVLILTPMIYRGELRKRTAWILCFTFFAVSIALPAWPPALMAAGFYRMRTVPELAKNHPLQYLTSLDRQIRVLFYRDDPNSNITVEVDKFHNHALVVNGKPDGSLAKADMTTTLLLGHLPALLTPPQGKAAVIGLGLGITANALATYPHIRGVDVFEIAAGVIEAQPHFQKINKDVLNNPKVTVKQVDAFRGLMTSQDQYATIVSEPSNPWVSGVDRLYSREFYETVKHKLLPGGIFAQWIHTYELSPEAFAMVMHTFAQSFPHMRLFHNVTDVIVLGSLEPWTEDSWRLGDERWKANHVETQLEEYGFTSFVDLGLRETFYPLALTSNAGEHSLFFPKLGYRANRDFYYDREFDLTSLEIEQPIYAMNSRQNWKSSLLSHGFASNIKTQGHALAACTSIEGKEADTDFAKLSPQCKSRLFHLIALNFVSAPESQAGFSGLAALFKKLIQSGFQANTGELSQHEHLLEFFPIGMPAPPKDYIENLSARCESEIHPADCRLKLARLGLKFGYLEEAKRAYSEVTKTENTEDNERIQLGEDIKNAERLNVTRQN